MTFDDIIGQDHLKKHLKVCYSNNRMPHAQLYVGETGYGTLPMALACANLILNSDPSRQTYSSVLQHPDFHIAVPVNNNKGKPSKPTTSDFIKTWLNLAKSNPYMDLKTWYAEIGIEKKKGLMSVHEADRIANELALKPHSGVAKVIVIWCADKLNTQAANKLLKLIEEPPEKTFLILTTDKEELLLDTIKSRCQRLYFPRLSQEAIREALVNRLSLDSSQADFVAQQADGNFSIAYNLAQNNQEELEFEQWFIDWVRLVFQAKKNKQVVMKLVEWSQTISENTRDKQIRFLKYCLHFFRQALLQNYQANDLVYLKTQTKFSLDKFAPFIHGNNIEHIYTTIQEAIFHIDRNVNSKMVITDTSIKLSRFIHMKA
ncbi:DNA polymerase III subunit delta' [Flavobacterium sp. CS20]|uniref:DNA polymerase III subunit n=1 Tax=Flavobacterium sp. CS20 TaxID=2775246 RepID=UPI001B39FE37|nr:DNA polymerase III subunit delta' [Flavobacterium sp. CS20]QTY26513.1 DNA polymerase III subunit delta' [Flavobacterium sp. CS20]